MKLLYIGCHSILEYDELKLFSHIPNLQLFSTGMYIRPDIICSVRPPLNFPVEQKYYDLWNKHEGKWNNQEFLDEFDIIYFMHRPDAVFDNWDLLKNRKVIWRTIGQSTPDLEYKMRSLKSENKNFKIVRYSPNERRHINYAGGDALIRFGKNIEEYNNWNGSIKKVVTVGQSMQERGDACGWNIFSEISNTLPCQLFGHNNAGAGALWNGHDLNYNDLYNIYRDYRVYFYSGTKPSSYCLNFIEAWMTGIPIVAIGPNMGNGMEELYEINDLIIDGENGFWSNDINDIKDICKMLLSDDVLANKISIAGRSSAIKIFNEENIQLQWAEFFKTL